MNDLFKLEGFGLDNILTDEKSHENILIYNISYKTFHIIGPNPFWIRFDKIDRLTRIYDRTRGLTLFLSKKLWCYNRIRYLISLKSSITYISSNCFVKIKVDSYDSLYLKKKD